MDHARAAHRRALVAVGRVSFTLAGLGAAACIQSPPTAGEPWAGHIDGMLDDIDHAIDGSADVLDDASDAGPDVMVDGMADAIVVDPEVEVDAAPTTDAAPDAMVWSETTPCPSPAEDQDAWAACCEARGWGGDDPLCSPWGPPMPPCMVA